MTVAPSGPRAGQPALVRRPEELTPEWLTAVLSGSDLLAAGSSVESFSVEPVGTGQMGDTMRIRYRTAPGDGAERSVVAKFASADEQSRSTGLLTRAYEIEVGFYRDGGRPHPHPDAPLLPPAVRARLPAGSSCCSRT